MAWQFVMLIYLFLSFTFPFFFVFWHPFSDPGDNAPIAPPGYTPVYDTEWPGSMDTGRNIALSAMATCVTWHAHTTGHKFLTQALTNHQICLHANFKLT